MHWSFSGQPNVRETFRINPDFASKEFTVRISIEKSQVQGWRDIEILIDAFVVELNFKNVIAFIVANALDVS